MALTHKQDIASRFSKAASQYYHLASIQNDIANIVRSTVPANQRLILDIGCATGEQTCRLGDSTIGLDLALGMVRDAKRKSGRSGWVSGDMDALPFASGVFSYVFSSMAMQWSNDPLVALTEVARVLGISGGASLLVPVSGSFQQLSLAYKQAGLSARLNPLRHEDEWLAACKKSGMSLRDKQIIVRTDYRDSAVDVLRSISKIGAASTSSEQPPMTRQHLLQLEQHYPMSPCGFGLDYRCLLMVLEK